MKYAHESTECNNLRYQFPKFCLVLHFLRRSMYRALDERATDWLKWISGKQGHSPKLSGESCFKYPFNFAGLYKQRSTKEATTNF